ncbi:MAG: hypothetical protein AAB487_02855 [Patescibacteria group bacterium]
MSFGEQPRKEGPSSERPKGMIIEEGEDHPESEIRQAELDPEIQEILRNQVKTEKGIIEKGFLTKSKEWLSSRIGKAAQVVVFGSTLILGAGKAEAGFLQELATTVGVGTLQGVVGDFDREQQRKNAEQWQRQQLEGQANQMALNNAWAREQRQEQMSDQGVQEKARAIQEEVRRFAQAIAQKGADLDHEEKIHIRIMDEIKKNY